MKNYITVILALCMSACALDSQVEDTGQVEQAVTHHVAILTPTADHHYPGNGAVECDPSGCYNPDGLWFTGVNDYGGANSGLSGYFIPTGTNDTATFTTTGWQTVNCSTITAVTDVTMKGHIWTDSGPVHAYAEYESPIFPFTNSRLQFATFVNGLRDQAFSYLMTVDPNTGGAWDRRALGCNVNGQMPNFGFGSVDNAVWYKDIQILVHYDTP